MIRFEFTISAIKTKAKALQTAFGPPRSITVPETPVVRHVTAALRADAKMTMVNRVKLARVLAALLRPRIPSDVQVIAANEDLALIAGGARQPLLTWDNDEVSDTERCRTLGYHVLNDVQDFIGIETRIQWPAPVSDG